MSNDTISNIMKIQQTQLADIRSIADRNPAMSANYGPAAISLENSLANLTGMLNSSALTTDHVLTHQNDMVNIVADETDRLAQKKDSIDSALTGQKRLSLMNTSYRKRYAQYTLIVVSFAVALAIFILLYFLKQWFPWIPSGTFDILSIIVFAIAVIYALNVYMGTTGRDPINYDEIAPPPPKYLSQSEQNAVNRKLSLSGNLMGGLAGCIGSQCCSDGTQWSPEVGKCLPATTLSSVPYSVPTGMSSAPASVTTTTVSPAPATVAPATVAPTTAPPSTVAPSTAPASEIAPVSPPVTLTQPFTTMNNNRSIGFSNYNA